MITIKKIERATSIYEWNEHLNSGADPILELGVRNKDNWGMATNQASRILIDIRPHTDNYNSASLKLFAANVEDESNRSSAVTIQANRLYESWTEGTEKYFDSPQKTNQTTGVTWKSRAVAITHNIFGTSEATLRAAGLTQSYQYQESSKGPVYYTGSNSGSAESGYPSNIYYHDADQYDMTFDITTYYGLVTESSGTNMNGLMIMHTPNDEEHGAIFVGSKKFFSNDTHTVYQPRLELKYDDYSWSSTNKVIGTDQATVYYRGNSGKYDSRSTVRFRPVVRESFPTASYSTSPQADTIKTFTSARSYYSIVDVRTDEEILGYDDIFTKVCADSEGMYFDVPLEGFPKDRIYKPVIKVVDRIAEGGVEYFDSKDHFEVV